MKIIESLSKFVKYGDQNMAVLQQPLLGHEGTQTLALYLSSLDTAVSP